jgi:undecaprenyl diphosphate synthase
MANEKSPIGVPEHISIIMDGNGRWAKKRNLPRTMGHKAGVSSILTAVKYCSAHGIKILSLFGFSTENWHRPKSEVLYLNQLFLVVLRQKITELQENNVQLRIVGNITEFSDNLQAEIIKSQQLTANNSGLKLVVALNYSGRWDIIQATRKIGEQIAAKILQPASIDMDTISTNLATHDFPDPDLLIRSSGEQRISNFMLWQLAYTELYFTDTLWPDFTDAELDKALNAYATRERRYGTISST